MGSLVRILRMAVHPNPPSKVIQDPVPLLQIFADQVCSGVLAAKWSTIKNRSVDQYLRSVGHIFVTVRTTDPFPKTMGGLKIRIWKTACVLCAPRPSHQSSLATPHLNSSFIKTPPLRVLPQGNMPSHISPGSLSHSFCDLVNNYNKSMDPYPTPPKSNK